VISTAIPFLLALAAQSGPAPACPPCTIELDPIVEIGALSDPVGRDMSTLVGRLSSGNWVVSPVRLGPALSLHDPMGRFVKVFQVRGQGPRELSGPVVLLRVVPGDSVYALSPGRLLTLDSELEPVADVVPIRLGSVSDFLPLANGRIAASHSLLTGPRTVSVLHLLDRAGEVVRSMDTQELRPESGRDRSARRRLAPASAGGFWSMTVADSRLQRYSDEGQLMSTVVVEREWFEPWTGAPRSAFVERPQSQTIWIQELAEDRVLLISTTADENWQPPEREPVLTDTTTFTAVNDWVVEVVDPSTGVIVASRRFDERVAPVWGAAGLLYRMHVTPVGDITARIFRISLVPTPGEPLPSQEPVRRRLGPSPPSYSLGGNDDKATRPHSRWRTLRDPSHESPCRAGGVH